MSIRPPFRADQVGSLLRSAPLKAARDKKAKGEISAAELTAVEDEEIKKLIAGEDIDRTSGDAAANARPAAGSSIPKTKRPKGPFGQPSPAGA